MVVKHVPFVLAFVSQLSLAATVSGAVVDENGAPIAESTVCLSSQSVTTAATPLCLQTQTTDAQGNYAFAVNEAGTYVVKVTDKRFPTYTWLPNGKKLTLAQASDTVAGVNFQRQFSFSNYQQAISISAASLPELPGFNPSQNTVFVKLYAVNPANPAQQTVFFIGQVTGETNLNFAASAPWPVKELKYEIFSATASAQGSLPIPS